MPVDMLNVPEVALAATVIDAGTVNAGDALFVNVTTEPPAGAACDNVTVHTVLPLDDNDAAVQVSPVTAGAADDVKVAVPPLAESGRPSPTSEALTGFVTPTTALVAPLAGVTLTVATIPLAIVSVVDP